MKHFEPAYIRAGQLQVLNMLRLTFLWFREILQFLTLLKDDNKNNNCEFLIGYVPILSLALSIIRKFIFQ